MIYYIEKLFSFQYFTWYFVECIDSKYGLDCSQSCGHCNKNKQCHHISGMCPYGCDPGYTGSQCIRGKHFLYQKKNAFTC